MAELGQLLTLDPDIDASFRESCSRTHRVIPPVDVINSPSWGTEEILLGRRGGGKIERTRTDRLTAVFTGEVKLKLFVYISHPNTVHEERELT